MTVDRSQLLLRLPLMEGVPEPIAVDVANAGRLLDFAAGDVIFSEGQPATSFSVLLSGSVKLLQLSSDGDVVVFRVLGAGDALGAVSLIGGDDYPVSAIAVTPASILGWPAAEMRAFLEQDPRLALNVLRSVSDRLQALRLQYRQLATENVERRIARALLKLLQRCGKAVAEGVLLDLPLSREDLAQMTGTTVYSVSRIVSRWEATGVLRSGRQQLVICDPDSLHAIANGAS